MFIPNLLSAESGSESIIVRARIIIVEDEPDLRDAVAEYLGANGYEVTTADGQRVRFHVMLDQPADALGDETIERL